MEPINFLVFDGNWIDNFDLCFYGRVDVDLVHYGDERYFKSFC